MTVKDFLRNLRKNEVIVSQKKAEIAKLESMAEYKGVHYGERISSSKSPDKHDNLIVTIADLRTELEADIVRLCTLKQKASKLIESLPDEKSVFIFYKRYFDGETWEDIASQLGITFQWVHKLHKRGLNLLSKTFENMV